MAKINRAAEKRTAERTHEGAAAPALSHEMQLRRAVLACLLWEDTFYESGEDIVSRIRGLVPLVAPGKVAALAVEARHEMQLRHVPLLLIREMARIPSHRLLVGDTLEKVISRADEPAEFLALYWKEGKSPLAKQVKKGLAASMRKFDAYALAKYNRRGSVRLKDALFMVHPKPADEEQAELWRRLADDTLPMPDTWETALSSGADKKETWERLLREKKLGALALLRNLRGMLNAGVDPSLIRRAIGSMHTGKVLPFRFLSAAREADVFAPELEQAMFKSLESAERLPGKTALMIDTSGSMFMNLSSRSDTSRLDAAFGLAVLCRELCEEAHIFTFSDRVVSIPAERGFALVRLMEDSQLHKGTFLGEAVREMNAGVGCDRLIVITDEQSADDVPAPRVPGYLINVASYRRGVGYGNWIHIDGWSSQVLRYIAESERREISAV